MALSGEERGDAPHPAAAPVAAATDLARSIAAGSLAAGFTASIFNPLEVVKTRLQLQESAGTTKLYDGFTHAIRRIAAEDGLLRLWQHGWTGFVMRDISYSGIRMGAYPMVRATLSGGVHEDEIGLLTKIASGCCTGAFGSALANPWDVVRVRMQNEGGVVDPKSGLLRTGPAAGRLPSHANGFVALRDIARSEGVLAGLWRGTSATMARAAMLSGSQLAAYDHSKHHLKRAGVLEEGTLLHVTAALISGVVATTACNPADVVKSRLMKEGSREIYSNAYEVVIWTLRSEGPRGFMRGWMPAYARAGPTFFIQVRAALLCLRAPPFFLPLATHCAPPHDTSWPMMIHMRLISRNEKTHTILKFEI